ncbi:leucyl/phenylalanyl-tRNA--protein transferase [Arcobacter sp. FWKO B]|uniref:leucyl/phenylalanyl-tRNA--protein transferase n=1 Tax=Arcobacter sp. FWKO B TaxID=2593672 RepID=UPI0018A64961|nr:leucyl/phenylalanyl-tRNA--protein transferase [Arcobacter sp. FWKO B]QOG11785.1 leucyl/phenylalanyl-tRNA--protein transferase [Arcobacter sp. FWKO B]
MFIRPLDKYCYTFPNPRFASDEGLLAYGGDLSMIRLLTAYKKGIFPWYNDGDPILWWSPNPRMVMFLEDFKVSISLNKTIKKNIFEVKFDTNFKEVMINCAKVKRNYTDHTWIQDEIIDAYYELHLNGYAHSFESYYNGELVGGGYGIVIGDIFCGESMFSLKTDASKVAFYYLVEKLKQNSFSMIDCQIPSDHLKSLGAKTISRNNFLNILKKSLTNSKVFI